MSKRRSEDMHKRSNQHHADYTERHEYHFEKKLQLSSTLANTSNFSKRSNTTAKSMSKIPKVISKLEKNIQTLKKYCTEMTKDRQRQHKHDRKDQSNGQETLTDRMMEDMLEPEVDRVREKYISVYGKPTNNLLQLYNFFKAYQDKSGLTDSSTSGVRFDNSLIGRPDRKCTPSQELSGDSAMLCRSGNVNQIIGQSGLMNRSHDGVRNSVCVVRREPDEEDSKMCKKRDSLKSKKYDCNDMPLQMKTLRIETETDLEMEKPKKEQRHQPHIMPYTEYISKKQVEKPRQAAIQQPQQKQVKAQIILQKPPLPPPSMPPVPLNINTNSQIVKTDQKWARPHNGTPHIATSNKPLDLPFTKALNNQSTDAKIQQTKMIYEKNMLINKRKQELNSKLKNEDRKGSFNLAELETVPTALDEAILIEPLSPVANKQNQRKNEDVLNKETMPLSKHDLSLWENMNMLEEMYMTGQINLNNRRQNIVAEGLELIKKKKGFKKSKFHVEQIPKLKKKGKEVQLIDIQTFSPETLKGPIVKKAKVDSGSKEDSLLGCDISVREDPLLNELLNIQCDF